MENLPRKTMILYLEIAIYFEIRGKINEELQQQLTGLPGGFIDENQDSSIENEDSPIENEDSSIENDDSSTEK